MKEQDAYIRQKLAYYGLCRALELHPERHMYLVGLFWVPDKTELHSQVVRTNLSRQSWQRDYISRLIHYGILTKHREGRKNFYVIDDVELLQKITKEEESLGGDILAWLIFQSWSGVNKPAILSRMDGEEIVEEEHAEKQLPLLAPPSETQEDDEEKSLLEALEQIVDSMVSMDKRMSNIEEAINTIPTPQNHNGTLKELAERLASLESKLAIPTMGDLRELRDTIKAHTVSVNDLFNERILQVVDSLRACSSIQESMVDELMGLTKKDVNNEPKDSKQIPDDIQRDKRKSQRNRAS